MNGVHDVGGMQCFGRVVPEENEPVFHAEWEKRVFGTMCLAMIDGHFNVDELRHAIEHIAPVEYVSIPYYGKWLRGMEDRLIAHGVITREELERKWTEVQQAGAGS